MNPHPLQDREMKGRKLMIFFPFTRSQYHSGVFSAALERHPVQNRDPCKNDEKYLKIIFCAIVSIPQTDGSAYSIRK